MRVCDVKGDSRMTKSIILTGVFNVAKAQCQDYNKYLKTVSDNYLVLSTVKGLCAYVADILCSLSTLIRTTETVILYLTFQD